MTNKNQKPNMETVQSFLKKDTRKVPPVLLEESQKNLGTDDIPKEVFLSRDYHDLEVEKLWKKVWQWVCREEQLPKVGDYLVYEIADLSVIMVRGIDNKIRGFYNSCLHRATPRQNLLKLASPCHERG